MYTSTCFFVNISTVCILYYISFIRKKTPKRRQGPYFACCLLVLFGVREIEPCVWGAALHSPALALRSWAMARFDLPRMCVGHSHQPPLSPLFFSTHQQKRMPHPNFLFFLQLRGPQAMLRRQMRSCSSSPCVMGGMGKGCSNC